MTQGPTPPRAVAHAATSGAAGPASRSEGHPPWRRYVALGDSFTEGLWDIDPAAPDQLHGWADRLAARLSSRRQADGARPLEYDKAADDNATHERLDHVGIKPVIENRALWKDDFERMLPGHDGSSNVVYDESGTVYCYDKVSDPPVRRRMAYLGGEPGRGTLKYRCPAMHEGWSCPSLQRCTRGAYGKCVRVKRDIDLRRFPAIPRATKQFERLYKGRTAVERVNGRIKVFWGADDGNITGAARFHALLGVVMVVHVGLATLLAASPRREGTLGKMRLGPIAKALREQWNP